MTPQEYKDYIKNDTIKIGQDVAIKMDKIDFLTIVYEDYCTKHGLPYVSADEQDLSDLDEKHINCIDNFIDMWHYAQDN